MPRKALQDGTEGVVKAQILIKNGVVHASVKRAELAMHEYSNE